jgi:hypothetical protein
MGRAGFALPALFRITEAGRLVLSRTLMADFRR